MSKKLSKEEFVQRSIAVHGNKYGYDLVEYKSGKDKVAIVCSKHGIFFQTPGHHMTGQGCPKCKIERSPALQKMSFDEFVTKARLVHGDKYQYDEESYSKVSCGLKIICPTHGEFMQLGTDHLRGCGCSKCSKARAGEPHRYTTEEFVKKATEVHCGKYDYSKVRYNKAHDKVTIICPIHGEFEQKAYEHLLGKGCHCCAGTKKLTTEGFIEKAREVHGDKYNYSLVDYRGNKTKVAIVCKEHGVFYQTPNCHLNGESCPVCQESVGERQTRRFLEKNNIRFEREKRFVNCRHIKSLPFDFYLPDSGTCIEFQGRQHYNVNSFFVRHDRFSELQKRDQIKRDYCSANGIKLIEIRYDENIEEKLNQHLQ